MNFQSLDRLLTDLAGLPIAQKIKDHQQLLNAWVIAVGPAIAQQTQPIAIQRDILQVATASAVLANDLTFKRRQILAKLNPQLTTAVRDIRFSSRNWDPSQTTNGRSPVSEQQILWQQHPSRVDNPRDPIGDLKTPAVDPVDPQQAFQAWATKIQQRSQNWPLCPECQCPTPQGELKRWQICGICAAKHWKEN